MKSLKTKNLISTITGVTFLLFVTVYDSFSQSQPKTIPRITLHGTVFEIVPLNSIKLPLDQVEVTLCDKDLNTLEAASTDQEGRFRFKLIPDSEYNLVAKKDNYYVNRVAIHTDKSANHNKEDIRLVLRSMNDRKENDVLYDCQKRYEDIEAIKKTHASQRIQFRIQLGLYDKYIPIKSFTDIENISVVHSDDGFMYTTGEFNTFQCARKALTEIRARGYKDARVSAYQHGKPIPVARVPETIVKK